MPSNSSATEQALQSPFFTRTNVTVLLVAILLSFGIGLFGASAINQHQVDRSDELHTLDSQILEKSRQLIDLQSQAMEIAGDIIADQNAGIGSAGSFEEQRNEVARLGHDAQTVQYQMGLLMAQREALLDLD